MPNANPRQVAFSILKEIDRRDTYTDVALNRGLNGAQLAGVDRGLVTELVYGVVRRRRSLDALIGQFARKPIEQQPADLRLIFYLGLYQLRYLNQIPAPAVVHTTVELAKNNGLRGLSGVVNGVLRQYTRLPGDPLKLPDPVAQRLGILHSYPNWIVEKWLTQLGETETEQLCEWFNHPPHLDLRVNIHKTSVEAVEKAFQESDIPVERLPYSPQGLRLLKKVGALQQLPGFEQGWWSIQDGSAQLVGYLLDPQPGEVAIDGCAAPGGKTTHLAELMGDRGTIWGCDRQGSRLKKVSQNAQRLDLHSIKTRVGDLREIEEFSKKGDRVLVDVPCSGLGTLHRHADARWRQSPESIKQLSMLQQELLTKASSWVKPGGILVYSTCTLDPQENEQVISRFLDQNPQWRISPVRSPEPLAHLSTPEGWIKIWPHRHQMDGFFMVRLQLM
ncbi:MULTISPECIES: 16S rRNA (cytosine(967)-C(5))-methyltransferase [unclassified Roseofilum]|uniref:16S rRNA (cytosine(967)-C(5))-methyltransferase n=1 Tax=unclassified Roseofilum TaxID=2620099 RepID=UPI000E81C376|nr:MULTISPECIES: 16S rRNA (cytosine(967)-C(5))-methyltransferase [unclassified Roseofilum]MBP0007273.1 16S rRNA (cytosine(967)-C(5))-methyltransferase [Roseofilum sp. Belize Diploria]MBP0032483.1 16S rRNA (cytosine(967)-C(5))-methyltransferase [Roseofilum sp. Belize BBD 4]HBR00955.1 16S rRNA (cytosine(967)-C(5))-methyltransferase [Cyanobacteria bacterium UBA11691]